MECQLKLRGMRHAVPRLTDITKGTSLARILTTLQKRLQGEKIDQSMLDRGTTTDHSTSISPGPASPIPSPSPSPSPLSSSSAANSPPATVSLQSTQTHAEPSDLTLALPGRKDSIAGRLSTPIPPTAQQTAALAKQPRAVSLESERESTSRLVHQGALQHAAVQQPDAHPAIPKHAVTESPPVSPHDTRPNPLAPSLGPGMMTPTPQNAPPVAPTPKSMLSISLSNLSKLTVDSPPHSPEGSCHPPRAACRCPRLT